MSDVQAILFNYKLHGMTRALANATFRLIDKSNYNEQHDNKTELRAQNSDQRRQRTNAACEILVLKTRNV